jgi:hypothetical protein
MEWAIPLQKLEVGKVQIGEAQHNEKTIVPLAYFDGQNTFPNLNILLPILKVKEFEYNSGKLLLNIKDQPHHEAKLNALQSTLLGAVFIQQHYWFPGFNYSLESLHTLFKPMIENGYLNLYFPALRPENTIKIYKNNKWYSKYEPGLLKEGDSVRLMFRIQGLCFHKNNSYQWTGKFRLQHRIYAILIN